MMFINDAVLPFPKYLELHKKTHSVTNSCHCCCSRAIFINGKIYKLTIYLKVKGSVISTPRGEAFYGLLLLLFHDCTKLFLPKCSIWPINCQKFPRQNEQTSVIVQVVGCVYVLVRLENRKRGEGKGRRRKAYQAEGKKVSPVWVCISGLTFYSKDKLFIQACDKLRLQF